MRKIEFAAAATAVLLSTATARAQHGARPPKTQGGGAAKPADDEDEDRGSLLRSEPTIEPPANPTLISPETRSQLGTDSEDRVPSPEGRLYQTRFFPYYEERQGDYRLRLLPPFVIERSRGLHDPSQQLYGVPKTETTEGLYGLLYYRRRSSSLDMDVGFPAFWRVRDRDNHVVVAGPFVHREAPLEHDNWLAPVLFEGARADGGYFHSPLLLTTSHWSAAGAFTLVGPYFRDRSGSDVDLGVVPFFFHGDNGNLEGSRRTYTIVPPLLFYHSRHELEDSSTTIVGPVIARSTPKRDIFDVAPLYFHIRGKPETGGVVEEHTTLLPFFHYGHDEDSSLLVLPGYYRRVTRTSDTMISPFASFAHTGGGATSFTAVGPIVPIWWDYRDRDLGVHAWAVAPFFFSSDSPSGHDWLTPVLGRFETYGEKRTWWLFPTVTLTSDRHGWEDDLHPIVYVGRNDDSSHTVVAPIFWDFANAKGRTTVGFPLYWRFADGPTDSIVQVAANTLYTEKRVPGGTDWQFHLLPLFSYGHSPTGYFWNVLFGLAGYSRESASAQVRALWIPFSVGGSKTVAQTASGN